MIETWEVDGLVLTDGIVRDVEYRDGLNSIPVTRGGGQVVAGRHGEMPGARLKYGPGAFVLNMWLEADGWDLLLRAIGQVHRLHDYTRGLRDGSRRVCRGRLSSEMQPAHLGQELMRVGAEILVPAAFWFDEDESTDASAVGGALPKDLLLTSKATATAPMGELTYTIVGPITNPTVVVTSDPEVFDSFSYNGSVPDGASLIVNSAGWDLGGTSGWVPDPTRLRWTGDRWLEVPPAMPGLVPAVRLIGSAGGAATGLIVSGPGAYLC